MWLAIVLILLGFVLALLGLVVMPGLGATTVAHRNARLASAIVGGFVALIGLVMAIAEMT